ncbi:DUF2254 domain-containing protein [Reyranella sp.]|uniref:DUF2254 domain-containing protein n=1 Tax=Reyranella sp. TaxID=1929291 RepID=UPI003BA9D8E2
MPLQLSDRTRTFLSAIRLLAVWDRLRTSFWFLPSLMTIGAIALSFVLIAVDGMIEEKVYREIDWVYLFGPEGARAILAAIASSMITVAGLTFSITMLTLQLASSQFGPRLLRNFMSDRGNQVVLGTFIATFVYCLLVLRTVKGVEGSSFVPHISVAVGVLLALASLAVLIYFIHHTAQSIRIESVLAGLAAETREAIDRLYPEKLGHEAPDEASPDDVFPPEGTTACALRPRHSGYVQFIDADTLMALASEHDLVVRVLVEPGTFVTPDRTFLEAAPAERIDDGRADALRQAMVLGDERTPAQDLAFSIRRLVEIAQRALSPGINDPTTGLYCVDRLTDALVRLAGRGVPSACRADDDGKLRVIVETLDFDMLATNAFAAIARYGAKDADVLHGLLDGLERVIAAAGPQPDSGLATLRGELRRQEGVVAFPVKSRRAANPTTGACNSTDSSTTT